MVGATCPERKSKIAVARPALRDTDIRLSLSSWLANEHRSDPSTVIYEELAIPRPTARVDLAVVNERFAGYEIKSDVDSLSRLAGQVKSYSHVFERVFLVTTSAKTSRLASVIPDWWGIIGTSDGHSFKYIRRGRLNKYLSAQHALYILEKMELISIANNHKIVVKRSSLKSDIILALLEKLSQKSIVFELREQLKLRDLRKNQASSSNSGW